MPPWEFYHENGMRFFKSWRYAQAIIFFDIALTKRPDDTDSIYHKALSYERLGKSDEACQTLFEALCINPHLQINIDNPTLLAKTCKLLVGNGDYKTALTICDTAIIRFPTNVEFITQRARLQDLIDRSKNEHETQIKSPIAYDLAYVRKFEKNETEINTPCVFKEINPSRTSQKLFQDVLEKKFNITTLWHFIRPDYLESILIHGILSRNECKNRGVPIADISDSEIQSHREEYHGYAPLFFAPCPPMVYRIMCENGGNIVALGIDPRIMDQEKILFSDGNVRVKHTKIFNSVYDLDKLDWPLIHRNPQESATFQTSDQKREHSAEVLISSAIPPTYIKSLSVCSQKMYNYVNNVLIKNNIDIRVSINLEEDGVNILRNS